MKQASFPRKAGALALSLAGILFLAAFDAVQQPGPLLPDSAVPQPLPPTEAASRTPEGFWLLDRDVVLNIYDCGSLVCGRIAWMRRPLDAAGHPDLDDHNPEPTLRSRPLCNLTIIEGLQPDGPDRWINGHVYNAQVGEGYDIDARLEPDGTIRARLYRGITVLGETKILTRVARGHGDGWC